MIDKQTRELQAKLVLKYLEFIQTGRKVYWVQTKHLSNYLFGKSDGKVFHRNKTRIRRYLEPFVKEGVVETTYRRETIGESTGTSLIQYYHYNK